MSKPDAFARAVERQIEAVTNAECDMTSGEALMLLRRHHAKIERLVRRMERRMATTLDASVEPRDDSWIGYQQACTDVLEALKEMRR